MNRIVNVKNPNSEKDNRYARENEKIEKIIHNENLHVDFSKHQKNISSKEIIDFIKNKFLKKRIYELKTVKGIANRQPHHFFNEKTLVIKDFPANFIRFEKLGIEFEDIDEMILSESPGKKNFQKEPFLKLIRGDGDTVIVDLRHQELDYKKSNFIYEYCPRKKGGSRIYGNKTVECEKICKISKNISIFYLNVKDKHENCKRKFTRIHYKNWEDGRLIGAEELEKLIKVIRKISEESLKKIRLVIHCNAGMGRSGRLAIALILKNQIKNKKIKESDENLNEKIAEVILRVVMDRIPAFEYPIYLADHFFKLIDQFLSFHFEKINAPREKAF